MQPAPDLTSKTSMPTVREYNHGDIVVKLSYVDPDPNDPNSDWGPAMILRPRRFRFTRRSAWIITLNSAWKYVSESDERHSGHMEEACRRICEMFGFTSDKLTMFRIAEAIHEHLEELINMPPAERPRRVIGIATGTIGNLHVESEVLD